MSISKDFWRGKKVFLTGHTGFKGSWLSEILLMLGTEVTGYALAPATTPDLFGVLGLQDRLVHHQADILDRRRLQDAVIAAQPDIVLHLAAQPIVRLSYAEPADTIGVNVMGTAHLLDAVRAAPGVKAVVCITSDKCYLNEDTGKLFEESDKLGGRDPYSASKAAAELVAYSYDHSYFRASGTALATARAGNVIGGGDWAQDRLIPDVARAAVARTPVVIRSPHATRPWQHVLEPLRGYLLLAEKLYGGGHAFAGGWNFGPAPADIQSVSAVLTELRRTLPFDLQMDDAPQPHEAQRLGLSIEKAAQGLGWRPQLPLKDALALTGGWYKTHAEGGDARALTQWQIRDYFGLS